MTRSIFDPTGGETEHSGSRNMGPAAGNISHLPPNVIDGEPSAEELTDVENAQNTQSTPIEGFRTDRTERGAAGIERPGDAGQGVE